MAKSTDTTAQSTDPVDVTIAVEHHEHQGRPLKKGDKITVDAETAAWLKQHKVIQE